MKKRKLKSLEDIEKLPAGDWVEADGSELNLMVIDEEEGSITVSGKGLSKKVKTIE